MTEYRPIPEDQREIFHEYVSYAFSPQEGPPVYDPDEHATPRNRLGTQRGLFESGAPEDANPLCVCRHYWFNTRIRDGSYLTPGLSAVASPPEHRRTGYVRELLEYSLEEYREREAPFSVLWPFSYRFYRQYGWDTTNRYLTVECEPERLSFARNRLERTVNNHQFRALDADEYAALESVYERHGERYDCTIERDADWWRYRVFEEWQTDPFVYVWERDGETAGYIRYVIDGDWGERSMRVSELVATDLEGFLALLAFCHDHDSQVTEVRIRLPVDTPLFDIATDPDELEVEYHTGPMARIVDIERALSALPYPTGFETTITLAVTDPLVDWNDGTFELAVAHGTGSCRRLEMGESVDSTVASDGSETDVTLDIATLSQLAIGARSVDALKRAGRLEAEAKPIETLETLFPERNIFLDEGF
ncbi:GNAT family N-acetyltransferase [Halobacteria archaeon AArc-curdl1]|uniref:GNAT family N-acetyltransferase n=1 Tax=Natronosalvus hydrolyticus TaxID=2979988 RepID=A0AAP3E7C3_9EURY|nr:GNAT family N-acetyltransferase [Halobacteria archaeon AArc-curdl1]